MRRADWTADGGRLGYVSALTALGADDGERRDYADIAAAVRDLSAEVAGDLTELFERCAMNVLLGNADDHLRNHGFLLGRAGWRLSPVFDVNPNPDPRALRATSVMGADGIEDEPDGLLVLAQECDLSLGWARERMGELCEVVAGWRRVAGQCGLTGRGLSVMEEALAVRHEAVRAVLAHQL